jgi:copper homeostasis protein (lipoprotein)
MRILLTGKILMILAIGMSGCIEHQSTAEKAPVNEQEVVYTYMKREREQLKGLRVYEGTIPCADCSGIYQRLALKGDTTGIFRLTETYRDATEDGDEIIVTTGSWKRYKVKNNDATKEILYLSEGSFADSSRIQRYTCHDKKIMQVDLNGDSLERTSSYMLTLVKESR